MPGFTQKESKQSSLTRRAAKMFHTEKMNTPETFSMKNLYDKKKMEFSYPRDGSFQVSPTEHGVRKRINRAHSKAIGRGS